MQTLLVRTQEVVDKGYKVLLDYIKNKEGIDDRSKRFHEIHVNAHHGDSDYTWKLVGAVLSDVSLDERGYFVDFVGYHATLNLRDPFKSLEEQMKIEKMETPQIDFYFMKNEKTPKNLRTLADKLEKVC